MYNFLFTYYNIYITFILKGYYMERENKTKRKREKCSDCYYNGNCIIPLSKCKYIIEKKKDIL